MKTGMCRAQTVRQPRGAIHALTYTEHLNCKATGEAQAGSEKIKNSPALTNHILIRKQNINEPANKHTTP